MRFDTEKEAGELNLGEFLDRDINLGFSGGELKRSELLQLLAYSLQLSLFDEPESGVDLENIVLVGKIMNRILSKNKDNASLIITHTGYIFDYVMADEGCVLAGSRIHCLGDPKGILREEVNEMKVYRCRICGEVYIGEEKPKSCPFCGAHENYFVPAEEWRLLKSEILSDITEENLRKALDLEIDNTNFHKAASEKSKSVYVASMFKGLSKVEREHASAISKLLRIEKPDSKIGLDKAVDSDRANIEKANRREKRAVKFYGEARSQVPEEEIKEFFKALMEIEADHIILTEQE